MPMRRSFKKLVARVTSFGQKSSRDRTKKEQCSTSDDISSAPPNIYQLPILDAGPDLSECYEEELDIPTIGPSSPTTYISTPSSSPLLIPRDFKNESRSASPESVSSKTFSDILPSFTEASSPISVHETEKEFCTATSDGLAVPDDEINKHLIQQLPFAGDGMSDHGPRTTHISTSSQSSEDDPFAPVLEALDTVRLQALALRIRRERHKSQRTISRLPKDLACKVSDQTMHGSYNVLLTLQFSDGQSWLARIPGQGLELSDLDHTRMDNEYQTMLYVKANYPIPVPEVYFWTSDRTHVGVPCALIELVEGIALDEIWEDINEQARLKILDRIAGSMVELAKQRFKSIGTLQFDSSEHYTGLGPIVCYLNTTYAAGRHQQEIGPFENLQQQLMHASIFNSLTKHDQHILMLAINSIPNFMLSNGSIALNFPDLGSQNIMVDEFGKITSFLDWDRVATSHMSTGCARYPTFLMDDWDPYRFDMDEELVGEQSKQLAKYRLIYSEAYAYYAQAKGLQGYDPRMTKLSHILFTIELMLYRREQRSLARDELLHYAFRGIPPFTIEQYATAFKEDSIQQYDAMIIETFKRMWSAEWDREGWSWGNSILEALEEEEQGTTGQETERMEDGGGSEDVEEETMATVEDMPTTIRSRIRSKARGSWKSIKKCFRSKKTSKGLSSRSGSGAASIGDMRMQQSTWLCRHSPGTSNDAGG